jgi:S-methylmethionine-dependent homocysteine/selenocysteine methylase
MGARVVPLRSERSARLVARLAAHAPLLLDGATGTELERRGQHAGLPLWSTHALIDAPETVFAIHGDYARAGADLLTANTFRTQRRTLHRGGSGRDPAQLTREAVQLARRATAAATREVFVLGSAPTLEDCYRPDRVPETAQLRREHAEHAANLATAGVDGIAIETMNSVREAEAAAAAARATGLPLLVSFVCDPHARLLSGEALLDGVRAVAPQLPELVAVNCLPPSSIPACVEVLQGEVARFGIYANLGQPHAGSGSEPCTPQRYAEHAARWLESGASLVGGCCGTTPDHTAAMRAEIDRRRI